MSHQIRLDLDDESAARLAAVAERAHAQQDDLAVTLLSEALAELEREPADVTSVLDRVPGAWERMQLASRPLAARRSGSTSCRWLTSS
jgi:6,7-dimethyl-8-ribityllumazine synthase